MADCEMFGMAVLSHGTKDGIVMTADCAIHVNAFVEPIKQNLTMLGKPKVKYKIFVKIQISNLFKTNEIRLK